MTAVTVPQAFEDKLKQRIRESIGELMSDADLKALVERSTAEILFQPRMGEMDRYGSRHQAPPLLQEILTPLIKDMAYSAVQEWAKHPENAQRMEELVKEQIGKGLLNAIGTALDQKFSQAFYTLGQHIRQALNLPQ